MDAFSIQWEWVKSAGGSMVRPGKPFLQNANEWKDIITMPDIDTWDWAGEAGKTKLDSRVSTMMTFINGFCFERLVSLMELAPAARAIIDDEQIDAIKALFAEFTDPGRKLVDTFCPYWPGLDGFTIHEKDPSGAEALRQKFYGAGHSSSDPRGTDTGCHIDLFVCDVADSVAVDELDSVSDAEFFSAEFRLLGEQPAHVDTGANDSQIACPGAQHLARTAAKIEHTGPQFQAQRLAESGELFRCERGMNAVTTFGDVENSWNVHCGKLLLAASGLSVQ